MTKGTGTTVRRTRRRAGVLAGFLSAAWAAAGGAAGPATPPAAARTASAAPAPAVAPGGRTNSEPSPERVRYFEQQVRPLLVEHCVGCHGERKQKGRLRLDSREAALKGGGTGPAVVPGDPAQSPLVRAVGYHDPDLQMPPDGKLADADAKVLADWVAMGAPWPKAAAGGGGATVAAGGSGKRRVIRDEDRRFWSFRPVVAVAPPALPDSTAAAAAAAAGWSRNPVDAFVLANLRAEGLTPAPEADRGTLIRRATFDLHGLPPTPEEVAAFVADPSPDAYEKLVDRLLASPRYGQRYARHWLDLVRYAESDGFKQDAYRPAAWRYRDWVIGALNADLPYDRFVTLQLAGDEVAPDSPDARVATGYLRCGIYEYNQRNAETQRAEYVNDLTDVTADAVLGLSMGCARCHDHKFDPILQTDYFRLRAFFAAVQPRDDLPAATPAGYPAALAKWEAATADVRARIAEAEAPARRATAAAVVGKFPPAVQATYAKPAADRTPHERLIAALVDRQVDEELKKLDDKFKGAAKAKLLALRAELAKFDADKPKAPEPVLGATDIGPAAPPTVIPGHPQEPALEPGYPVVLDGLKLPTPPVVPTATSTGRRTALARWLTDPANPLPPRVIVNRLWQWHFGRGLVRTGSDYGTLGEPPTHPELLDYLAARFVAAPDAGAQGFGWGIKAMHRLIMTSAAYRQAAARDVPELAKLKDPDNRWLWRQNARRLQAEQIRDAMLAASGELREPSANSEPPGTGGPAADYTAPVRSVFTKQVRNNRDPLLDAFDLAEAFGSVAERNVTTTPTQSLLMVNGDWPLLRAAAFARRLTREAASADPGETVDRAYRLAYARDPRPDERAAAVAFLNESRGTVSVASPIERSPSVSTAGTVSTSGPPTNPGARTEEQRDRPDARAAAGAVAGASASARDALADPVPSDDAPVTQLMPQTGGRAILVRGDNPSDVLRLPGTQPHLLGDRFTVEAFVLLESADDSAAVRVIASQWDGRQTSPGWSLGVTGERSAHQPRNLILQLVGAAPDGVGAPNGGAAADAAARTAAAGPRAGGYEAVASGLRLEPHRVYYVGVAVDLADTSPAGVTFWLKDVGDMDASLRTARVRHAVTAPVASARPLVIGGVADGGGAGAAGAADAAEPRRPARGWVGLIGEVRLADAALKPEQNLWNEGNAGGAVVGHWTFEESPGLLRDAAGRQPNLVPAAAAAGGRATGGAGGTGGSSAERPGRTETTVKVDAALVDFCHALFNSNEFLYVD